MALRARSLPLIAAIVLFGALAVAAPAAGAQSAPAEATGVLQTQWAVGVVVAGLVGLVLFGIRHLGMRVILNRRAHRP